MEHAEEVRLIERALAALSGGSPELGPGSAANPIECYLSEEWLAREREVLFRRFPLAVGFSSQVARPGEFLSHDASGTPILVVRGRDGALRAFVNACRHRGVRLVSEAAGRGKRELVCPFHGWTYGADGQLLQIPGAEGFPDLDRSERPLVPLPVTERFGLVFAVPTPWETGFDFDRFLGPPLGDLSDLGLSEFMMVRPTTRTRALNWKLYLDATHEVYHLSTLHGTTAGAGYFGNLGLHDCFPPHARIVLPSKSLLELPGTDPAGWRLLDHAGILYSVFPNTTLLVHSGFVQVLSSFPAGVDSAVLQAGMLVPKGPVDADEAALRQFHYDTYWKTMEEDLAMCESTQSSLRSGANAELLFGRYEHVLAEYHAAVRAALEGRLVP